MMEFDTKPVIAGQPGGSAPQHPYLSPQPQHVHPHVAHAMAAAPYGYHHHQGPLPPHVSQPMPMMGMPPPPPHPHGGMPMTPYGTPPPQPPPPGCPGMGMAAAAVGALAGSPSPPSSSPSPPPPPQFLGLPPAGAPVGMPGAGGDMAAAGAAAVAAAGATGGAVTADGGRRIVCDACTVRRADVRAPCGHAFHARCFYQLPVLRCPICQAETHTGDGLEIMPVEPYTDRPADELAAMGAAGLGSTASAGGGGASGHVEDGEQPRTGRWHTYETAYAQMIVEDFDAGTLPISEGTKLGAFLCSMLACSPTRLGKKLRIGKKYYQSSGRRPEDEASIARHAERMRRMSEIEEMFLMCESQTSRGAVNAARLSERIQTEWRERFIGRAHSLNQRLKNAWHWNTSRKKVTVSAGTMSKLLSSMQPGKAGEFALSPLAPLFLVQHSPDAEATFRALSSDLAGVLSLLNTPEGAHAMKLFTPPQPPGMVSAPGGASGGTQGLALAAAAAAAVAARNGGEAATSNGMGNATAANNWLQSGDGSVAGGCVDMGGAAASGGGGGSASRAPSPWGQNEFAASLLGGGDGGGSGDGSAAGGAPVGVVDDDAIGAEDHDLWTSLGDNLACLGYQNSLLATDHATMTPPPRGENGTPGGNTSHSENDDSESMEGGDGPLPRSAPPQHPLAPAPPLQQATPPPGAACGVPAPASGDGLQQNGGAAAAPASASGGGAWPSSGAPAPAPAPAAWAPSSGAGAAASAEGSTSGAGDKAASENASVAALGVAAGGGDGSSSSTADEDEEHSSHKFQDFIGNFLAQVPFEAVDVWVPLSRQGDSSGVVLFHAGYFTNVPELEEWGDYSTNFSFNLGEGLPGRVYYSNTSEWQPDVQQTDNNMFLRLNGALQLGIRTTFGVPVVSRRGVTFVIVFYSRDTVQLTGALREFIERTVTQWKFDATFDSE